MEKRKVAIIGGAFDPPTKGHLELAKCLLNFPLFDEVLITPCNQHAFNKKMTLAHHRIKMCEIMTKDYSKINVFDYEIKNNISGGTSVLIERICKDPDYKDFFDIYFVIGMDNANNLHEWINYEQLKKTVKFVVVPRKGVNRDASVNWYLKEPHLYLDGAKINIPDTSSTEVRACFHDYYNEYSIFGGETEPSYSIKTDILDFLPNNSVFNYIFKEKLYQKEQ